MQAPTKTWDWRGNEYDLFEPIGSMCETCGAEAVRLECSYHGEEHRTHWHGGVHMEPGRHLRWFCERCRP